ncbi:pimeloyl-ACP methyl ester esterase BioH [Paraglaciecola sp.]|uniref:pimeloyl-ACP methyl ester esterase BioH n=1 Tax=Paraglaciecola sp. TaxID=1920173 RepID=UPI0030F3E3C2
MNLVSTTVGQGPNLVLLHGWGLNSGVWQPCIEQLTSSFTVTTIDLPGFGLNHEQLPEPYSLASVAEAICKVLPETCILVGWSLGGLVAQQVALLAGNQIKHLMVVASSPRFIADDNWSGMQFSVLDNFNAQLELNLPATISRFLAIQAMGSPTAKQDIKMIKQHMDNYPPANSLALSAGLQLLAQSDLRTQLTDIQCPLHFMLGRLDSLVPIKLQENLQDLHHKINITVFDKSSHAPFISEQQRFIEVLVKTVRN